MRNLRRYEGRTVLVAAATGDYRAVLLRATREGVELTGTRVVVNGRDIDLVGVVFVPAGQVVHVQVDDS